MIYDKEISVLNPLGERVKISLVSRNYYVDMAKKERSFVKDYYSMAMKQREVYEFISGVVFINYTDCEYLIKVESYEEAKKILNNKYYGSIIIHINENKIHYCFDLYSDYFNHFKVYSKPEYGKQYGSFFFFKGEKKPYKTVYGDNGIIHYFKRTENVYQGTWYPEERAIEYFHSFDS